VIVRDRTIRGMVLNHMRPPDLASAGFPRTHGNQISTV
jgi:hypothetical protein